MVYFPARKCYHTIKVTFLVVLVIAVLALFEQWRGGKRGTTAFSDSEESEFERQVLEDEARIVPGLGEGGVAAYLTGEDKRLGDESEKRLAMNVYLSDRISYNRTLRDHRNPACKRVTYDAELPSASVVLIFHNEPYSVVVRTIWSVINSCRRTNKWFQQANYVDTKGRNMKLGYPGQDPNSPLVYLKEIILVDDNSTLPELKGKLSHYVRTRLPPDLIRILRLPNRIGIPRARLEGAKLAKGEVLVFLDSHCETLKDWLRPLLQRLNEERIAVLVPLIDSIDESSFEYLAMDTQAHNVCSIGIPRSRLEGARLAQGEVLVFLDSHCEGSTDWLRPLLQSIKDDRKTVVTPSIHTISKHSFEMRMIRDQVGGFTFTGHFTWIDVPDREKKRRGSDIAPTWSPTMAGGLFAINRAYYWELGAYDEQMAGWGGENLEMSFRIWQCGGTLETIPCSRVGHVFRSFHPYGMPEHTDTHGVNTARMAEVWMDEYAELFYLHRPDLRNNPKIGDVTHRKILREKLQCKSFQWYLDNIYKEKFVPVRDAYGYGRFQNPSTGLCLDTLQREADESALGLYPCHAGLQATQYLILSLEHELRGEEDCAHVLHKRRSSQEVDDISRKVLMSTCRGKKTERKWSYNPSTEQIQHSDGLCLDASAGAGADVAARACAPGAAQRWTIDYSEENDFRMSNEIEPNDQQQKLSRLRGQNSSKKHERMKSRISRSLLSYSNSNSISNSLQNGTVRRHTHKKHKKRSRKNKKTKNKFILKLVKTLKNNTEDHLEVEIHCKHKKLYPNNTFVRDLVSILNDQDIKVINNGRVFERNKVTQLSSSPTAEHIVLNKMDIAEQQAPPPLQSIGKKGRTGGSPEQWQLNPMDAAQPPAPPAPPAEHKPKKSRKKTKLPLLQPLQAELSLPPSDSAPPAPATESQAHRIIIEDFVALTPSNTVKPRRMKKRKRKRPTGAPGSPVGARDSGEDRDLVTLLAQKLPANLQGIRQISVPQSEERPAKESSEADAAMLLQGSGPEAERRGRGSEEGDAIWSLDEPQFLNNSEWRQRMRHGDEDNQLTDGRSAPSEAAPPVKVVMRSNLTFNLGDEFFQWKRAESERTSNDLSIPSVRTSPPVHELRRGSGPEPQASTENRIQTKDSDDDSSTSDSNSSDQDK